jgi:FecR protein/Putative zinc-finger
MFTRHVSRHLAAHLDAKLSPVQAKRVESHLRKCPRCRAERAQIEQGIAEMDNLPLVEAPQAIWSSLEAALQEKPRPAFRWRWAVAAATVLVLAGATYWRVARPIAPVWQITRLDGSTARIGAGEWIETDGRSHATIQVGTIGSVEVAPNTRLRIVATRADDHRLSLARGEIQATISAPPKLFFVETASGTAVDLGCQYDLKTAEDGTGLLRVTRGWVSFEWKGVESLVPEGAICRTNPHAGPGIPYFDDAPDTLKQAVETLGYEKSLEDPLKIILSASRVRDTLTLWHLLSRLDASDRERVFDRIAALTPIPATVSREQVLKLDSYALTRLKDELAWKW